MSKSQNQLIRFFLFAGIILGSISFSCSHDQPQSASLSGKKEIPVITFKNLSPPYTDYDYFLGSQAYGFQFNATSFNVINAWWLAEISTLVCADEDFVRSRFEAAGLSNVRFFDKQSTQCFVANNDKYAIIAFRGSEIWKKRQTLDLNEVLADLKADVDIRELKFIDSDGTIRDSMVENEIPVNQPRDETYGQARSSQPAFSFRGFIPAPFRDHVPLLYAVHLWNNIIAIQE